MRGERMLSPTYRPYRGSKPDRVTHCVSQERNSSAKHLPPGTRMFPQRPSEATAFRPSPVTHPTTHSPVPCEKTPRTRTRIFGPRTVPSRTLSKTLRRIDEGGVASYIPRVEYDAPSGISGGVVLKVGLKARPEQSSRAGGGPGPPLFFVRASESSIQSPLRA